jgi:methylated-DNA-[protein]-cysteine S-methyltransferase
MPYFYTYLNSPAGDLLLAGDGAHLCYLSFAAGPKARQPESTWRQDPTPFTEATRQLNAYFAGGLVQFNLPLSPQGTAFQRSVWQQLQAIPYGATISYGELARRIGNPAASRAVGLANGSNPIAIIIPCHRVIGSSGKLTGFAGGIETKRLLLNLESGTLPGML